MTLDLKALKVLCAKTRPPRDDVIHPDNPFWGPRLAAFRNAITPQIVSELIAEVERLRQRTEHAEESMEFLRNRYTLFGGRACPACLYESGKFVRSCQLHEYVNASEHATREYAERAEQLEAERDAALTEVERLRALIREWRAARQSVDEDVKLSFAEDNIREIRYMNALEAVDAEASK